MLVKALFSIIIILISASGISYQFLISHTLIQFSQDEVLNQSITLGFYLLSMGIGAALVDKIFKSKTLKNIFFLEAAIAFFGLLLVPLIYLFHIGNNIFFSINATELFYGNHVVFKMQIFTTIIGFLTGCELPLLIDISKKEKFLQISTAKILALNYVGALIGSIFSAGVIIPKVDFISTGILISTVSLLATAGIFILAIRKIRWIFSSIFLAQLATTFFVSGYSFELDQIFLKNYYLNMKVPEVSILHIRNMYKFLSSLDPIERYMTNYQIIDMMPDTFMTKYGRNSEFILYLNNHVQFSRQNYKMYHETMVHGALNITKKQPQNILVLGGGDGLILTELRKIQDVKTITQVELDPQVIELATHHSVLSEFNKSIYSEAKLNIIIADGFDYIRKTEIRYDAIFVDFPFPTSYELSKLYSVEFYSLLKKIMNKDAFFVFDAPITINPNLITKDKKPSPQDIIHSTLRAAGFNNIYAYGLTESFYIVSTSEDKMQINYEDIPSWISNQTIVNLSAITQALNNAEISTSYVNSIFKPQKFIFK